MLSLLDKVGKAAMDTIEKAARAKEKVQSRLDPLIERSDVATRMRDRIAPPKRNLAEIPTPESNASPFFIPEAPAPEEEVAPLADPDKAAQIFGAGTDPWTGRSLQLLADRGIEHDFVDLETEGGLGIETQLIRETSQQTSPYVFLRGEIIGGFDALNEIERLGQLEEMVKPAEERNKGRVRIKVAKRGADGMRVGERGTDDRK
jgi:glutaredoxin